MHVEDFVCGDACACAFLARLSHFEIYYVGSQFGRHNVRCHAMVAEQGDQGRVFSAHSAVCAQYHNVFFGEFASAGSALRGSFDVVYDLF